MLVNNKYIGSAPNFINKRGGATNTRRVQAFLIATGISDPTTISALNALDNSLIAAGLLPSGLGSGIIYALFPFVGGTSTTCKYNFVDPSNVITWHGGVTFNSNGITGNGTNSYGLMTFSPNDLGANTAGFSIYSRDVSAIDHRAFGVYQTSPTRHFYLYPRYSDNNTYQACNSGEQSEANSNGSGNFIITRQSSSTYNVFIRGTKTTKSATASVSSVLIPILAADINGTIGDFSTANLAMATAFSSSLTDQQAADYKTADDNFQTALSRNI